MISEMVVYLIGIAVISTGVTSAVTWDKRKPRKKKEVPAGYENSLFNRNENAFYYCLFSGNHLYNSLQDEVIGARIRTLLKEGLTEKQIPIHQQGSGYDFIWFLVEDPNTNNRKIRIPFTSTMSHVTETVKDRIIKEYPHLKKMKHRLWQEEFFLRQVSSLEELRCKINGYPRYVDPMDGQMDYIRKVHSKAKVAINGVYYWTDAWKKRLREGNITHIEATPLNCDWAMKNNTIRIEGYESDQFVIDDMNSDDIYNMCTGAKELEDKISDFLNSREGIYEYQSEYWEPHDGEKCYTNREKAYKPVLTINGRMYTDYAEWEEDFRKQEKIETIGCERQKGAMLVEFADEQRARIIYEYYEFYVNYKYYAGGLDSKEMVSLPGNRKIGTKYLCSGRDEILNIFRHYCEKGNVIYKKQWVEKIKIEYQ